MAEKDRPDPELNDVFNVTQVTRATALEDIVGADVVTVNPGSTSQVHRHNRGGDDPLHPLSRAWAFVLVGDTPVPVAAGDRVLIHKGVFHGVRTEGSRLRFLSVQSPPILNKARDFLDLEPLDGGD